MKSRILDPFTYTQPIIIVSFSDSEREHSDSDNSSSGLQVTLKEVHNYGAKKLQFTTLNKEIQVFLLTVISYLWPFTLISIT